jgi:hypothetical protein
MAIEIKNTQGKVIFTLCANDLLGANLQGANLKSANLRSTNLQGADLQGANLRSTNLQGADMSGANVLSINASDATNDYDIFATNTHLRIGCHCHSWDDWMGFDDFSVMTDGAWDNKFWLLWKPILQAIATDRGWL